MRPTLSSKPQLEAVFTLGLSAVELSGCENGNHTRLHVKTAVLRPSWRHDLSTTTTELWCSRFVVILLLITRPRLLSGHVCVCWAGQGSEGLICHPPESSCYAYLPFFLRFPFKLSFPESDLWKQCRMQWPTPGRTLPFLAVVSPRCTPYFSALAILAGLRDHGNMKPSASFSGPGVMETWPSASGAACAAQYKQTCENKSY